ncbi:MAG: restriction endonuclease [Desulfomonilaceae bacterium]
MTDEVKCGDCGKVLDESPSLKPSERNPCPYCGSKLRRGTAGVKLVSSPGIQGSFLVAPPLEMLLQQTITIHGERTHQGVIIEAIAIPWLEIIRLLETDPAAAFEIPPRTWEEIIAGSYTRAGFDEVILTPRSGDLGRDVIAVRKGFCTVRVIDQVKAFRKDRPVTANDVRALMGVLAADPGVSKGYVTTTSDFAPKIAEDPGIKPWLPYRLELINGEKLRARLIELAK